MIGRSRSCKNLLFFLRKSGSIISAHHVNSTPQNNHLTTNRLLARPTTSQAKHSRSIAHVASPQTAPWRAASQSAAAVDLHIRYTITMRRPEREWCGFSHYSTCCFTPHLHCARADTACAPNSLCQQLQACLVTCGGMCWMWNPTGTCSSWARCVQLVGERGLALSGGDSGCRGERAGECTRAVLQPDADECRL